MTATPALEADSDRDLLGVLSRHSDHTSAFLAVNEGNAYHRVPGVDGVVAYRTVGRRYWIQLGGVCAAPEHRDRLWTSFLRAARARGRRVVAVQLQAEEAVRAAETGLSVTQLGTSYSLQLSELALSGRRFVKTRNMISRSRREGVTVAEVGVDVPLEPDLAVQLDEIDAEWLQDKGWHVRELELLVGQRGGRFASQRRLFVALVAGRTVAYISYSPVFGSRPGWLYDLTRRRPDAPPGVIEHIFQEAGLRLAEQGAEWMHLGLTPFVGLDRQHRIDGAHSAALGAGLQWVGSHAGWIYPSAGQVAFKLKWRPSVRTPEYVAMPGHPRLRDALALARATNAL
jgi:lysylphosphatidylglycerol synthetase-like protein (DUF2156 family)